MATSHYLNQWWLVCWRMYELRCGIKVLILFQTSRAVFNYYMLNRQGNYITDKAMNIEYVRGFCWNSADLTLCGLAMPIDFIDLGQLWLGLLPDSATPLPEPVLSCPRRRSVTFTWEQFHKNCSWTWYVMCVWHYCCISQGRMSWFKEIALDMF